MQLTIPLSKSRGPLFHQVYQGLREKILSGDLRGGEKLPSTRDLAEQLGISRTVALLAYDQLLAEGFATGRAGSGTYVSSVVRFRPQVAPEGAAKLPLSRFGSSAAAAWTRMNFPVRSEHALPYDFGYGRSDLGAFPFELWRRILLRCARRATASAHDYGPAGGNLRLREAICNHLLRSRAVVSDASQVIVVNGSQQAIDLIARVLFREGESVAVEDPSYQGTTEVLRASGARVLPIAVDREGINPATIPQNAQVVFITPSHQYPTGAILPLARRLELLAWGRRNHGVIIEDDYDGEFRYGGQPLESLQGLDREGRVLYVGTFSRTIFSALRIGYLIVPKKLITAFAAAKWLCDRHTASLEQEALAEFIATGMYERHLRRMRKQNAGRRAALLGAVRAHLGERVEITGDGAGAHIVLWPRRRVSEESVIAAAAKLGVRVYGISPYYLRKSRKTGILIGYSRMNEPQIREGIRRLGQVI
jgi:GntR family transcriptional regulator/MocR family aminotransferase